MVNHPNRCCPDPNCDGQLEYERDGYWHCNGLAHNQGDTRVTILLPKAYDRAVKEGDELAERMGEGWTSRVWENGGWHYEAVKSVASVGPRLSHLDGHGDWRIVEYVAIINTLLHGSATAATPEDAMGLLLQDLRAKERQLSADLAAINE